MNNRFPSKSFFRPWKASLGLNHFWDFFKRLKKGSFDLQNSFYLGLSLIGSIFLEKIEFEKRPQNGQISPKSKGVNLNFLTILDHFWDLLKRLKKGSLGLEKRFYLGLTFTGRIFLEKIHEVYSPGRITRFQCSPANNRFPSKSFFRPWKASLGLNHFWDFFKRL